MEINNIDISGIITWISSEDSHYFAINCNGIQVTIYSTLYQPVLNKHILVKDGKLIFITLPAKPETFCNLSSAVIEAGTIEQI